MPGIVGLITKLPRKDAERQLLRMVEPLRHGPLYRTGTWIDESLGVYVGWSVLEGSFADGMPLANERGTSVLVFSGEEFPEPGTRPGLARRGHRFDARGCAYLVHVSEEDDRFPASLNGRFHGLLADRARGTVTLFNDRYGMHRVYYHHGKDAFYFAAEAKAILAVCPKCRRADPRGVGELVACGSVLEDRTLFHDIHVLPAGSRWVFRDAILERKGRYFHPREWEEQEVLAPDDYARELRTVFSQKPSAGISKPGSTSACPSLEGWTPG